jgi:hypothetical protein
MRASTALIAAVAFVAIASPVLAQPRDSTRAYRRIQPLPALGSAPETGLQYGATVLAVFEPAAVSRTRASSIIASAIRSTKSQTRVSIEGERWTPGNAQRLYGQLAWQEFPLPYYGIGAASAESAREIYTPRGIELQLSAQQRLRGPLYATLGTRILDQRLRFDSTSALRSDAITGSAGGRTVELTGGVLLDTRDHLFAPARGTFSQLTFTVSDPTYGSQYTYQRARLDARRYMQLAPAHILAAHLVTIGTTGRVPFDQLPLTGGSDILRGYTRGRYRDRYLAAAQLEYRSPFVRRVGAVAFAGAGTIGTRFGDLASTSLIPTYGAGLRIQIDPQQRTAVRADYARGRDGASGLYIGFNQSF